MHHSQSHKPLRCQLLSGPNCQLAGIFCTQFAAIENINYGFHCSWDFFHTQASVFQRLFFKTWHSGLNCMMDNLSRPGEQCSVLPFSGDGSRSGNQGIGLWMKGADREMEQTAWETGAQFPAEQKLMRVHDCQSKSKRDWRCRECLAPTCYPQTALRKDGWVAFSFYSETVFNWH